MFEPRSLEANGSSEKVQVDELLTCEVTEGDRKKQNESLPRKVKYQSLIKLDSKRFMIPVSLPKIVSRSSGVFALSQTNNP
jgi:hypothetical protein